MTGAKETVAVLAAYVPEKFPNALAPVYILAYTVI
jgi:hypothetical protein